MFDTGDTADDGGDVSVGADSSVDAALALLADGVAAVGALDLTCCTSDGLLELLRGLETHRRRLTAIDHGLVAEVHGRGVAAERLCAKTADLLVGLLRIDPREARARVAAAAELGPRRELTGAPLEPLFPAVAAACAAGVISDRHARIITATIDALPASVAAVKDREVEAFLTEQAEQVDPAVLAKIARRLSDTLDPDGKYSDAADRERRRHFRVSQRSDGSAAVSGELDAICAEALLTVFDTLARPVPADDHGMRDPGSAGQRRHDALREAMLMCLRTGSLPDCGGTSTTMLFTLSQSDATTGEGLALAGHGALIPVRQVLTLGGDAQIQRVELSPLREIAAYSSTQRLFTAGQRLAMTARDGGCSIPGCTVPPAQCQAHHIVDFAKGGPTSVANGTLICGYHHREFLGRGWRAVLIDGCPHWIPPAWLDPTQIPRRNQVHRPSIAGR